jgi:hypothetical protein
MTRFYFDIRDNGDLRRDETGVELPDLEAAIAHARDRYADRLVGPGAAGQEPALRVEIRSAPDELPAFVLDAATLDSAP